VQQPSVVIFYHYLRFMFQTYFYFTEETDDLITLQGLLTTATASLTPNLPQGLGIV